MNPSRISLVFVALLALTSCGAMRRAGKDISIVALSPGVILYGGSTDGASAAQEVRKGTGGGWATEALAFPLTFVFHTVKHMGYVVIHAVDFAFFPFYGLADMNPYGPEIEPLDFYTGTIFDREPEKKGTDADSGETTEK